MVWVQDIMTVQTKVVVAGDVTIDWIQWNIEKKEDYVSSTNWESFPNLSMSPQEGGALQLANMINKGMSIRNLRDHTLIKYEVKDLANISPDAIIHSNVLLDKYPYKIDDLSKTSNNKKNYRIKEFLGYIGPTDKKVNPQTQSNDENNIDAKFIILDDAGNGFRDDAEKFGEKSHWPKALESTNDIAIILKTCKPLCKGDLWNKLFPSGNKNEAGTKKNIIVIVNANDLRDEGLNISRRLSWEKSSEDFSRQIFINNKFIANSLRKCNNLIVRFGVDGVIHYSYNNGEEKAVLYYDPAISEDSFKNKYPGGMQGLTNAFVAHLAVTMMEFGPEAIEKSIINGIIASRRLLKIGFGEETIIFSDSLFDEIFTGTVEKTNEDALHNIQKIQIINNGKAYPHGWTIMGKSVDNIDKAALDIVLYGHEKSLPGVPVVSFGDLITLDRLEIESYQSIKNLILEYIEKENPKAPLSIAVFGAPGSGKSFGISQLAKSIAATNKEKINIEIMEFNVAQFRSPDDLCFVFHKVRDMVLEGKMPLVFFDEFDCYYEKKLGWLKYFLAPMQDGKFIESDTIHPIGKSIFIFAGGTGHTFSEFSREKIDEKDIDKEKAIKQEFIDSKGPDFVSRLKGYVDIQSIDKNDKNEDAFYKIRRAIILRNCLKKKSKNIFEVNGIARIDECVIKAFLNVEKFKHGARSMEAIIEMSPLSNRKWFDQSALPPKEQLELHVNADKFLEKLEKN